MTSRPTIVVFVKAPAPGFAKTRLIPRLGPEDAAELARCFILDAARQARAVCPNVLMAYAGDFALLDALSIQGVTWTEQPGGDLGERLETIVSQVFASGAAPVVVIGADSPSLPSEYLSQAMQILTDGAIDCVLGPADDGGFYLIGLRQISHGLFSNIAWSTSETGDQMRRNIDACGLRLHMLPLWYDVDMPEDLERLTEEIRSDAAVRERAPATAGRLSPIMPAIIVPAINDRPAREPPERG
ncbi:MAG: TIGR04282 family arsenosugar biosynthesis glycosyltransferase [Capsulimonas sp.]|uniref:TIGR04282 family arsenosugar biosynthesis glycosyltransferase n=1 Tax=Capsulimonas sp. TaxID=2494211 RepID=UPI0032657480